MKKQLSIQKLPSVGILTLIFFTLSSCYYTGKIVVQDDIVYSTKRIILDSYHSDKQRDSPLISLKQSIVKEIKSNNATTVKVYDNLALTSSAFKLEEKVFMIIDKNVYPMEIDFIEYEHAKIFTENTEDVLTSDSTTVSVVSGYSENNKKLTRFCYELSDDLIGKIKMSKQIKFRYYAGPSMITIVLNEMALYKLKRLIDMV